MVQTLETRGELLHSAVGFGDTLLERAELAEVLGQTQHAHAGESRILDLLRKTDIEPVLHIITDGRDTAPRAALEFLAEVEAALADLEPAERQLFLKVSYAFQR